MAYVSDIHRGKEDEDDLDYNKANRRGHRGAANICEYLRLIDD
jgi:hypothetical protein